MFSYTKFSEDKKERFIQQLDEYNLLQHSIAEACSDSLIGNKNLDYLNGFEDAMKITELRLHAVLKMTHITEACTREFINKMLAETLRTRRMVNTWKDKALYEMECHEASEHFEDYMNRPQTTPCDFEDYNGNHSCPYDAQGGDDCRNFCGLGVDE